MSYPLFCIFYFPNCYQDSLAAAYLFSDAMFEFGLLQDLGCSQLLRAIP